MNIKLLILALTLSMAVNAQEVDFYLPDLENEEFSFEDLKGEKLTLIDFWATWCKPCSQLIPSLNTFQTTWSGDLKVIGISIDSPRSMNKIKPYVTAMGVNYSILLDSDQDVSSDLNISAIPTLLLVDAEGTIVWTHEGYTLGDEKIIEQKIIYYLEKL